MPDNTLKQITEELNSMHSLLMHGCTGDDMATTHEDDISDWWIVEAQGCMARALQLYRDAIRNAAL